MESSKETSLDAKLAPESFVADISFAAGALRRQPAVAMVSFLLWSLPIVADAAPIAALHKGSFGLFILDLVIFLVWMGWAGAERIFFLRHLQKQPVTVGELLELSSSFFGRFLALSLLGSLASLFVMVPLMVACAPTKIHPLRFHLGLALLLTAADFVLTFVPSALAFTTRSARRALRIGFQMIRQTWPRCGLYVLCPPLALNFVNAIYPMHLSGVRLVVTAGVTVIGLLAKGATAAFYLRERPTYGPDGAAHLITAADEASALLVRD